MLGAMLASPERVASPARKRALGLSSFYHDSAACLVEDGEIVVALQEERQSRLKHDADFPVHASRACLADAYITSDDLDRVVFYEIPSLHVERVLDSQLRFVPRGIRAFPRAIRSLFGGKMWVERAIAEGLSYEGRVLFVPHHLAEWSPTCSSSPPRETPAERSARPCSARRSSSPARDRRAPREGMRCAARCSAPAWTTRGSRARWTGLGWSMNGWTTSRSTTAPQPRSGAAT